MKGATVALAVGLPLVLGGAGVGAYFLFRRKTPSLSPYASPAEQAAAMGAAQFAAGGKAVSNAVPPGAGGGAGGLAGLGGLYSGVKGAAINVAGKYLDNYIPGLGGAAKGVVGTVDKIASKTLGKIPGLGSLGSKLKLW